jgi:hypothetical protein
MNPAERALLCSGVAVAAAEIKGFLNRVSVICYQVAEHGCHALFRQWLQTSSYCAQGLVAAISGISRITCRKRAVLAQDLGVSVVLCGTLTPVLVFGTAGLWEERMGRL